MLATEYFAESITSSEGFWGLKCTGLMQYIFGICQNSNEDKDDDDDFDFDDDDMTEKSFALMGDGCEMK